MRKIDLTAGPILRTLLLFGIPIFLRSLFQQLYSTCDAIIIGQFFGKSGLAVIDSVYSLNRLPLVFIMGFANGAGILIGQYYAAKEEGDVKQVLSNAIFLGSSLGLVLSAAFIIFAPSLLELLGVPADIRADALAYVRICFSSLAFSAFFNVLAGALQAMGDSKASFVILLISGLFNLVLDLIMVAILGFGIKCAALSTALAQVLNAILVFFYARKHFAFAFDFSISKDRLLQIIFIGLPLSLQSIFYPVANFIVQRSINMLGSDSIAAWALCGKLDFLLFLIVDSLALALSNYVAQNHGAGKGERMHKGVCIIMVFTLALSIALSAVLFFFGGAISRLFIRREDYFIIPIAVSMLAFLCPCYFIYAIGEVLANAVKGLGDTFRPMLLSLLGTCLVRILWVSFFARQNSAMSVLACYPASWAVSALLFIILYWRTMRKMKIVKGGV